MNQFPAPKETTRLTQAQMKAMLVLRDDEWKSSHTMRLPVPTLEALQHRGWVERKIAESGFVLWKLSAEGRKVQLNWRGT